MGDTYEIMHKDTVTARLDRNGQCEILAADFLPYNLYLEAEKDIDTLVNNITNFHYWCATRVLTLDRKYAKEILNSIGAMQAVTDRDRANIALSYRCVSLTDVFWVRMTGEEIDFAQINLYDNHLSNAFIDISLQGKQYSVDRSSLARDLSTNGSFPKAWKREGQQFRLLKDGGSEIVENELLASQICQCFAANQVVYTEDWFDGQKVTSSENITSKRYAIASMEALQIYTANHDEELLSYILALDDYGYYMMNILDYLVGNTDRHWGNWGVLVDNETNRPLRLHELMDFNCAFRAYDTLDGANCQTTFGRRLSQGEAAIEAVQKIGLPQIREVPDELFAHRSVVKEMFHRRLERLKRHL